jgi:hypothetical protein
MDQSFYKGFEVENPFQSLKAYFKTTPLLIHVNLSKPFVLEMDASNFVVGATLTI